MHTASNYWDAWIIFRSMSQNGMATADESFKMKSLLSQVKMSSWNKVSRVWDLKKREILVLTVLGGFFLIISTLLFENNCIYIFFNIIIYIYICTKYLQTYSFTINLREESKSTACHNILYHQIIYNEISESQICTIKFPVYEQRGGKNHSELETI